MGCSQTVFMWFHAPAHLSSLRVPMFLQKKGSPRVRVRDGSARRARPPHARRTPARSWVVERLTRLLAIFLRLVSGQLRILSKSPPGGDAFFANLGVLGDANIPGRERDQLTFYSVLFCPSPFHSFDVQNIKCDLRNPHTLLF